MVLGCFVEVWKRRNPKVNFGKCEMIVLGREEGSVYNMDNHSGLLGIMLNGQIREFCGVKKEVDERTDESVFR